MCASTETRSAERPRDARRAGGPAPTRIVVIALVALCLAAPGLTPDAASAVAQSPEPGRRIAAAGREFWLSCAGRGHPAVLLEAGHGETSATWRRIQPAIAAYTRVCSYDRAGLGRSTASPRERRRGSDVVSDLRALLRTAGETGPWVMVGHSLGGAFVRLYAAAYPRDVIGLVLLDAVHPREFAAIDELLLPAQRAAGAHMRPLSREGLDIEAILAEVLAIRRRPTVPLLVIARGRPLADDEMPPDWSAAQRRRREQLRRELQADLATASPAGRLVVARHSGHFVHHDEPALVVAAVKELVERWRAAPDLK
jgi:pimeloyl-ACP methyl ester carboxylesterase